MPLKSWIGWQGLVSAVLGIAVAAGCWLALDRDIDRQSEKVRLLKYEIAKLDKEIEEVRDLKDQIQAILARKRIVETLRVNRMDAVRLLEELARQRPAGVRFTAVREERGRLFIAGFASSERAVAALVTNLEGSPELAARAQLDELHAGRFRVSAALKGGRPPAVGVAAPRIPSDVHPGDPK